MKKKLSGIAAIIFLVSLATSLLAITVPSASAATYPAWDFEDHSKTHTDVTTMTSDALINELTTMNGLFANHSLPAPRHYDYPNGAFNDDAIAIISQYRDSARTAGGAPFPNINGTMNWYLLGAANIDENKTFADVKAWIDDAVSKKALAVLYTHGVYTASDPLFQIYGTTPEVLQSVVNYLVSQQNAGNLSVLTMRQAYTQFNGAKAVVVMAFDDGTNTDYTVVWPMFKAAGIAGTSYIVGDYVESQSNSLTWLQIQEMAQVGQFTPPAPTATAWGALMEATPKAGGTTNYGTGSIIVLPGLLYARAIPAAGYTFDHWDFQGTNYTDASMTFPQQPYGTIVTVTAVFRPTNVTPSANWSLNITANGPGVTNPAGLLNVTSGTIRVNATANANSTFSYWQFDNANVTSAFNVTSTNTTSSIIVPQQAANSSHTLTAFFANASAPATVWSLNVSINGSVGGTTAPSGVMNVTTGSIVVNATAAANYTFSQWRLDNVTLANTTSVTVPAQTAGSNHTLTAFFNPVWNLTIAVNGTVGGTTSPSGNMTVLTGSITVNATAAANYTFSAWQLDNITIGNTTTITVPPQAPGSSHVLTAVFVRSTSPSAIAAADVKP